MENLCDYCIERQNSIHRVEEFLERNPDGKGIVCDPAPKAECKWHKSYGYDNDSQKSRCRDFVPL